MGTSRRGKKNHGSLNLHIIHKGICFSKYFHTWSFTGFLADFSPAATELRRAVRQRGRRYFDPAHTGSVTLPKTVTRASPQQVLGGPWLLAWRSGRLGFFPSLDFSLMLLLPRSQLFPLDSRQLLGVCVCNLLFRCCWLVPGRWLLNL